MEEESTETEMGRGTVKSDGERNSGMSSSKNGSKTGHSVRRPGRPKKSVTAEKVVTQELVNSGSATSRRGRPKGSIKRNAMEELTITEVGRGDTVKTDEESNVDMSTNLPIKRGRGRPQGSKELKVYVTDLNLAEPQRGIKTHTSTEDISKKGQSVKKPGRPKKSVTAEKAIDEELMDRGSDAPCTKESVKRKSESLTSGEKEGGPEPPRKRGRPKGSPNKKPKATWDESNGLSDTLRRGRGAPRKSIEQRPVRQELVTGGSQPGKRGRGRPKGSLNKVHSNVGQLQKDSGFLVKGRKRGRPRQKPGKRGRPRKYPLPSSEEPKKPKVWKPLGRPRKYPRAEPPEGAQLAPRRSRGRPRKSEVKKGAHLRKTIPTTPSTPRSLADGLKRKRGRPPTAAKSEGATPQKRGRPKGSLNKNKTRSDGSLPNHSAAERVSPAVELESGVAVLLEAD
ncbi:high mobility group protein hmg-12 isoform X3 [Nothobranchius furzeri]|nr:transcript variant X13 [Nothobranchius furzeri]KAF7211012.1 transcript variant X12 [Nothobranchius furzeri]KAF7211013.1 transcript variant X11 [Nothobranchius furzeri]KAF7211017.1 transcript variant X14 [Nothobranchius furzeri]KAF7211019.1 transcript variant X15 [Nothobranchius furzeri]